MSTALLVIDTQVGLLTGAEAVYQAEAVLARIARLIARVRAAGTPVIYLQDKDVGGVGSPEWQIHPAVAPAAGELVIEKAWADSFHETDLHAALAARGVRRLAICGLKTEVCVSMTSLRAITLGYDVQLATDAHSTTDNEIIGAPQTIAYHNDWLWGFGRNDGFGNSQHWIEAVLSDAIELA